MKGRGDAVSFPSRHNSIVLFFCLLRYGPPLGTWIAAADDDQSFVGKKLEKLYQIAYMPPPPPLCFLRRWRPSLLFRAALSPPSTPRCWISSFVPHGTLVLHYVPAVVLYDGLILHDCLQPPHVYYSIAGLPCFLLSPSSFFFDSRSSPIDVSVFFFSFFFSVLDP